MTTTWAPTTDQILNLDGVRHRIDSFRFELCDRELKPIGTLHPDRETSVPQIQNDSSTNTSRRLTNFKLLPQEAVHVNPISDRVRPYMVLQNGHEERLGTFLWADGNRPRRSWGNELHSELVDFTFILDQSVTQVFGWGRGGTITLIMFFLMFRAGFELADIAVIGEEAARGLAEPLSWEPGVTWLQMLTDLGNLVGFVPPWFDRDGRLHFDQIPDPTLDEPTVDSYGSGTRVIADSIVFSDEQLSSASDFAVYDSGTESSRLGRYQLPASAPHSFQNRGFRIGKTESVQGLTTQAQADMGARNLARSSDVYEYLTFNSTADPRHETYDIIDAFDERWLETGWTMELRSGGTMTHNLKRVNYDVV